MDGGVHSCCFCWTSQQLSVPTIDHGSFRSILLEWNLLWFCSFLEGRFQKLELEQTYLWGPAGFNSCLWPGMLLPSLAGITIIQYGMGQSVLTMVVHALVVSCSDYGNALSEAALEDHSETSACTECCCLTAWSVQNRLFPLVWFYCSPDYILIILLLFITFMAVISCPEYLPYGRRKSRI